jgi:hypothetical protein
MLIKRDKKYWIDSVKETLEIFSDMLFQKRVWVDNIIKDEWEKWSSLGETFCCVEEDAYEDLLYKAWSQYKFSHDLFIKLEKFYKAVEKFSHKPEFVNLTDKEAIEHKEWYPITLLAKDALEQLEKEMEGRDFEGVIEY